MLKQQPLCLLCSRQGRDTTSTVVDHIKPHNGDPVLFWDVNNLQTLCKQCHDSAKQIRDRHGVYPGCDVDGLPLDGDHRWGGG